MEVIGAIVLHHLNTTLDAVLYIMQHGFRRRLSSWETLLCATYREIVRHADQSCTVHAVVLDFAKAFDKVSHQLLMKELSEVPNISSQILMWIHDFLKDRRQKVVINGLNSSDLSVTSGVPQGSVLGPTLFLAYLPKSVTCHISLFADDTLIYQVVNSTHQKNSFQSDINALETWTHTWCMKFNVGKCSVLVFNRSQSSPQANYTLDGIPLQITQETKYLGVVIQSDWDLQVF